MRFPRQEYWNGSPFLSLGDLPDPGIKPKSPALAGVKYRETFRECRRSPVAPKSNHKSPPSSSRVTLGGKAVEGGTGKNFRCLAGHQEKLSVGVHTQTPTVQTCEKGSPQYGSSISHFLRPCTGDPELDLPSWAQSAPRTVKRY